MGGPLLWAEMIVMRKLNGIYPDLRVLIYEI